MNKNFIFLFFIVLVISAAIVKFSDIEKTESTEKTKISIVLDYVPNTNHTGIFTAKEKGYYDELGLDVNIISAVDDGALSMVASGSANFGISFQEELALALTLDSPINVTAVAAVIENNTSGIISLKDKSITRMKELEGKSYATWNTPVYDAIVKNAVEADGGNFENVKLVPVNSTDSLASIQTECDAVWVFEGWDKAIADFMGIEANFIPLAEYGSQFNYYTPVIICSDSFIDYRKNDVSKFMEATKKGYIFAADNPEECTEIMSKHIPEMEKDKLLESQKLLSARYASDKQKWGQIDQKRWDGFFEFLYNEKIISRSISKGRGFTNEFVK